MEKKEFIENFTKFDFTSFDGIDDFVLDASYCVRTVRFSSEKQKETDGLTLVSCLDDFVFSLRLNFFQEKNENVIIICVRDNVDLLEFCLSKLLVSTESSFCDILVVDDRSITFDIYETCKKHKVSYLHVMNSANIFSYSMLNNIAVAVIQKINKKRCLFWNCDMWPSSSGTLKNLIEKHIQSKATLSGTRLVYPSLEDYKKIYKTNEDDLKTEFNFFETIQHAGVDFCRLFSSDSKNKKVSFTQTHPYRLYPSNHPLACRDAPKIVVTGAFWIISTQDFISEGGFNPSLASFHQDIDFCLRLSSSGKIVYYLGSEFLYHAENFFHKQFETHVRQHFIDDMIYHYIWDDKLKNLLGFEFCF